jgi:hypothetical protein
MDRAFGAHRLPEQHREVGAPMTAVILTAVIFYIIGRLQKFGAHHEHAFQEWRDRIHRSALLPTVTP